MSGQHRLWLAGLLLLAVLTIVGLVAFAGSACPVEMEQQPCPEADRNVAIVIVLASMATAAGVVPFAFLAEFIARRRIVYRGAWWRAGRRGVLAGLLVAALAGLRLGDALSVPVAIFLVVLAAIVERFLAARDA